MKLRGLEAMRGLAALSVAIAHSDSSIGSNPALHFARWHAYEMPGTPGVEFFFVLSGFVMALMHAGEIGRGGRVGVFLWRRICRIYPIYFIALAIMAWRFWGAPSITASNLLEWGSLLPIRTDNLIVVAWTLRQEVTFYLIFALCLLPRVGWVVLAGWVIGTAGVWLLGWSLALQGTIAVLAGHVLNPFNFEFFAGLLAGALFRRLPARSFPAAAVLGAAAALLGMRLRQDGWGAEYGPTEARLTYGLAYGGILLGLAMLERSGALRFHGWAGRVAAAAGVVSYPLYLSHLMTIGWVADSLAAQGLPARLGPDLCFVLFLTASVLGGIVLAYGLDRPIQAGLRRIRFGINAGSRSSRAAQA